MQGVEIMSLKSSTLLELIVLGLKTTNLELLKIIKKEINERVVGHGDKNIPKRCEQEQRQR
jgi:hypothetical protein